MTHEESLAFEISRYLPKWESVIVGTAAAARGDKGAADAVAPTLARLAQDQHITALVAALRRIIGGERETIVPDGLDPIGTVIANEVLARLNLPIRQTPRGTGMSRVSATNPKYGFFEVRESIFAARKRARPPKTEVLISTISAITGPQAIQVLRRETGSAT